MANVREGDRLLTNDEEHRLLILLDMYSVYIEEEAVEEGKTQLELLNHLQELDDEEKAEFLASMEEEQERQELEEHEHSARYLHELHQERIRFGDFLENIISSNEDLNQDDVVF